LHVRNLLGAAGYAQLLAEIAEGEEVRSAAPGEAAALGEEVNQSRASSPSSSPPHSLTASPGKAEEPERLVAEGPPKNTWNDLSLFGGAEKT